ncbi:23911_t:CDS:1, partial [Racocetra persica]
SPVRFCPALSISLTFSIRIPTELVFNVIKSYVESQEPRTEEELREATDDKVRSLQEEDLTKYFRECLDFGFVLKIGH